LNIEAFSVPASKIVMADTAIKKRHNFETNIHISTLNPKIINNNNTEIKINVYCYTFLKNT